MNRRDCLSTFVAVAAGAAIPLSNTTVATDPVRRFVFGSNKLGNLWDWEWTHSKTFSTGGCGVSLEDMMSQFYGAIADSSLPVYYRLENGKEICVHRGGNHEPA